MENTEKTTPGKEEIKMVIQDGILKYSDLPKIMKEFRKPIDEQGLQESLGSETKKGYDTLGYGYAWISERLNDVVGFCWRIVEQNETHKEVKTAKGDNTMHEVSVDVIVQLGNWKNKEIEENVSLPIGGDQQVKVKQNYKIIRDFEVLAETPIGNGWHKAFSLADARKGAKTNGFKKAAGFFGIGNEAYKKSIDDENREVKETLAKKRSRKTNIQAATLQQGSVNLSLVKQKLEALGAKTDEEKIQMLKERFNFTAMNINTLNDKQLKMILAKILQAQKQ